MYYNYTVFLLLIYIYIYWRNCNGKLEQLYEGKAKKVFKTDDPEVLMVDYKDDATAFNGEKREQSSLRVLLITVLPTIL